MASDINYASSKGEALDFHPSEPLLLGLRRVLGWYSIIAGALGAADWFEGARRTGLFAWNAAPYDLRWNLLLEIVTAIGGIGIVTAGAMLLSARNSWFWVMRVSVFFEIISRVAEFIWNQLNLPGNAFAFSASAWADVLISQLSTAVIPHGLLLALTFTPIVRLLTQRRNMNR